MPQEPQELAANEWGTITYYPQWNALELTRRPGCWTDQEANRAAQAAG